jgi:hypothetical protein
MGHLRGARSVLVALALGFTACSSSVDGTPGDNAHDRPDSPGPSGGDNAGDTDVSGGPTGAGDTDTGAGDSETGAGDANDAGDTDTNGGGTGTPANTGKECSAVAAGDHEQYGLPVLSHFATGVTTQTDWSAQPASGGWSGQQVMNDCRMRADGFDTWHSRAAVRIEVQPHDDPLDLGENTERTEGLVLQDTSGNEIQWSSASGDLFFATSYYFPTTWAGTFYGYSVFETAGTWPHGVSDDCSEDDGNICNSWSFPTQFYPWGALAAAQRTVGGPQIFSLSLGDSDIPFGSHSAITLGAWTDMVFEINFTSGAVKVWRRDEGSSAFTQIGSATVPPPEGEVYLKQGLYRGGNVNGRTDVLWIGPTAVATTFTAAEQAAFGTSVGP